MARFDYMERASARAMPISLEPAFDRDSVSPVPDDLSREVYGIFGMPIDALDRRAALERIVAAASRRNPFLISTPNVNFMTVAKREPAFRESLLASDLCAADGMPIVWIARLLGFPIPERVSGSDLFDTIQRDCSATGPLKVFLFGGGEGVAEKVSGILNSKASGIRCVGWLYPGFGSIETMSSEEIIDAINSSKADLLALFLSAKKAQAWLLHNHHRLNVPVRGQFGATINYQAGTVRRAPLLLQRLGMEWLWRIKEEPYLWRRYAADGLSLIKMVMLRALPIALNQRRAERAGAAAQLSLEKQERPGCMVVYLSGHATKASAAKSIEFFRNILSDQRSVVIDLSRAESFHSRYIGLLLMLRKELKRSGLDLSFTGASAKTARSFEVQGFGFLLHNDHLNVVKIETGTTLSS